MPFGICILSIVPVRAEPNDRAEMTTQLLFGDLVVKTMEYNNWIKIRIVSDNYEGWIDSKQYLPIDEQEFNRLGKANQEHALDLVNLVSSRKDNKVIPILLGSSLPGISDGSFSIGGDIYKYEGTLSGLTPTKQHLIENAMLYLNAPYLWGGKSPFGIDCSGFTQMAYRVSGLNLSRDAVDQAKQGETLNLLSEASEGDLLFFDNEEEEIIHVGILLSESKIIHASGKVRIDQIDHHGIFNNEQKKYTHKLRLIKRII